MNPRALGRFALAAERGERRADCLHCGAVLDPPARLTCSLLCTVAQSHHVLKRERLAEHQVHKTRKRPDGFARRHPLNSEQVL